MYNLDLPYICSMLEKKVPNKYSVKMVVWLVVEPTHLKNMTVKLDHFNGDLPR